MMSEGLIPGSYVIVAPEKGMKTRLPTAGIACVLIIQHILRSYIDQFMVMDARIGPSVLPGDAFSNPIKVSGWESMKLRSLDATTATDKHPFAWQREIYSVLLDYLPDIEFFQRVRKLIPWICVRAFY
jgi:hypothetical protein